VAELLAGIAHLPVDGVRLVWEIVEAGTSMRISSEEPSDFVRVSRCVTVPREPFAR
jgi:hypothetical protein